MPNKQVDKKKIILEHSVKAWNTMCKTYGPPDTLTFLAKFNYSLEGLAFIINNLDLPSSLDRAKIVKELFKLDKSQVFNDFKTNQELLNTINAWNAMLNIHGPNETLAFLSLRNYSAKTIQFLIANLELPSSINPVIAAENIIKNKNRGMATDLIGNQNLLTTIKYLDKMLGVHGPKETLDFLASCNYSKGSIKFLTANIHLPKSLNRAVEAEKIIKKIPIKTNTDFLSNQNLLYTVTYLNKMLDVYGPNETLTFLATCNYNHQSIKFLTANLRLPKSIDKSIEAEKLIKNTKEGYSSDFTTNTKLIGIMNKWLMRSKNQGLNETLVSLSKTSYRAKSIKLIVANLPFPETMDRATEAKRIIKSTNKNVISKFKKDLPDLAEKKLDLHTLTNLIYSFDLPENDVKVLKKEAIVKTQEAIGRDVQADLNKKTLNEKMEQLQISVPNYIKQIQQEPNDIETYLDTMYLRQVKEKANIRTLPSNSPSVVTNKNKDTSHHR